MQEKGSINEKLKLTINPAIKMIMHYANKVICFSHACYITDVSEVTYNVLMGTLNPTHSLIHHTKNSSQVL